MKIKRTALLLICAAAGLLSFVMLDLWSSRNAPIFKRLEQKWSEDVELLESSNQLPKGWNEIGEVTLFGGNPETKALLRKIDVPIRPKKKDGAFKLDVLVVVWEAEGKRGALIQYNLIDLKTKNMVAEVARTIMLKDPEAKDPVREFFKELNL